MNETTTNKLKGALKSKMIWAAFAYAVLNAAYVALPQLKPYVNPEGFAYINMFFTTVVAGLRWVTTQALDAKSDA